jgi:hypothetical protein
MYICILYFPCLLEGFLHICTPVHVYICGLWPLWNTTSLFLTWYQSGFSACDRRHQLRQRYQPSRDALYLSVIRQEQALQQGESTIDEFYTQSASIWRQLYSLRTAVCGTYPCCRTMPLDLEFQRIFEFLSQLRKEFEPRHAQLLAHGRVPISEVLYEL